MDDPQPVILAFSADQVVSLTGLSQRQLAYWDTTEFFKPEYPSGHPGAPFDRIYSFRDVVGLRTIAVLRGKHGVTLPHLRKTAQRLARYTDRPWSELHLKVWNRRVVFLEPETGKPQEAVAGQYVLLPMIEIIEDVKRDVESMKRRRPDQIGGVEKHRYVSHNAQVIAGTRISTATISRFLEDGYSIGEILREYPTLTEQDIRSVQAGLAA